MEAVVLVGIQGSGKSTFYRDRFGGSHVHINLDTLKTRHREGLLLQEFLDAKRPFVVDNTNPTIQARRRYIEPAQAAGVRLLGYYFSTDIQTALARNAQRSAAQCVPAKAIRATRNRLELPTLAEGFDALFYVRSVADGSFVVEEWTE
jgi:predicted kinase